VVPIFDKIQLPLNSNPDVPQQRIWWYPTGPLTFIPIHAAGPGKGDIDVSRLVISSYVTTLSSLFQAHTIREQDLVGRPKLLAVSQQDTPGQESLPRKRGVVSSAGWLNEDIVCLSGPDATTYRVSGQLNTSSWVHLACHGMQHPTSGMSSEFSLHVVGADHILLFKCIPFTKHGRSSKHAKDPDLVAGPKRSRGRPNKTVDPTRVVVPDVDACISNRRFVD
jgi:hypothetical protein